jgi:hypothetical protein
MSDEVRCALCQQPIEARQTVVFQADGQLAHVTCLASTEAPLTRLVPKPTPDPISAACSKPIGPAQSIRTAEPDRRVAADLPARELSPVHRAGAEATAATASMKRSRSTAEAPGRLASL